MLCFRACARAASCECRGAFCRGTHCASAVMCTGSICAGRVTGQVLVVVAERLAAAGQSTPQLPACSDAWRMRAMRVVLHTPLCGPKALTVTHSTSNSMHASAAAAVTSRHVQRAIYRLPFPPPRSSFCRLTCLRVTFARTAAPKGATGDAHVIMPRLQASTRPVTRPTRSPILVRLVSDAATLCCPIRARHALAYVAGQTFTVAIHICLVAGTRLAQTRAWSNIGAAAATTPTPPHHSPQQHTGTTASPTRLTHAQAPNQQTIDADADN
jgi:hypothetical protein